jgi:hypothetical protein
MVKDKFIELKFSEETSSWHSNDQRHNEFFIRMTEEHLNNLIPALGYVDLKEVLRELGYSDEYIRHAIELYGNYAWGFHDRNIVKLEINPYAIELGVDTDIRIDVTDLKRI